MWMKAVGLRSPSASRRGSGRRGTPAECFPRGTTEVAGRTPGRARPASGGRRTERSGGDHEESNEMLHRRTTVRPVSGDPVTAVGNDAVRPAAAIDQVGLTVVGEDHVSSISTRDDRRGRARKNASPLAPPKSPDRFRRAVSRSAPPFPQITSARCRRRRPRASAVQRETAGNRRSWLFVRSPSNCVDSAAIVTVPPPEGAQVMSRSPKVAVCPAEIGGWSQVIRRARRAGAARTPVRDQRLGLATPRTELAVSLPSLVSVNLSSALDREGRVWVRESAPSTRSAQRSAGPAAPTVQRLPGRSERLPDRELGPA